ncbi:hypothetical protein B0T14DRAFT_517353 [Immersiella caudata]|uniref:Uncharacterized protein n=1 Tax=Immersiella caudata TaxID=314043 RepID=A0AA40C4H5_9PEZI|nr:hypothetical protein B0T14DRAFT_517353 [Immersiella caudata]
MPHIAPTQILRLSILYTLLIFASGFLFALVRIPLLEPHLGQRYAELVEMPFMGIIMWKAAGITATRVRLQHDTHTPIEGKILNLKWEGFAVGLLALTWFLLIEGGVYTWMHRNDGGGSWMDWVWGRDPVAGAVFFAMLGWFAVLPGIMGWGWPGGRARLGGGIK